MVRESLCHFMGGGAIPMRCQERKSIPYCTLAKRRVGAMTMIEKTIKIKILGHKGGDLLMAVSDDLRGLVVHGRSDEEIEERLPGAVRDLLEADGFDVVSLQIKRQDESPVPDFGPPTFVANASLAGQIRVS
jgi:hypothetical protein